MIWLVGAVLMLQTIFYWILKPIIIFTTPIFELRGLGLIIIFIGAWLIAGRSASEGPY